MHSEAAALIARLGLCPHPEGGHYRENWRANDTIPADALPPGFGGGDRPAATCIYFLLQGNEFSTLHRIASDELWFFHAGAPLEVVSLAPDGETAAGTRLGLGADATPSHVVPAGHMFGARVSQGGAFSLVSCVVAPGCDFRDFEMPSRAALLAEFPRFAGLVLSLTRP